MARIFVDTVAWIGLINTSDKLHPQMRKTLSGLRAANHTLLTHEFVLLEVADALSAPESRRKTVEFIDGLKNIATLEIALASHDLLTAGWHLYKKRPDKDWSLTDCISFVLM